MRYIYEVCFDFEYLGQLSNNYYWCRDKRVAPKDDVLDGEDVTAYIQSSVDQASEVAAAAASERRGCWQRRR